MRRGVREEGSRPEHTGSEGGHERWRTPSKVVESVTLPTMLEFDGVLTSTTTSESLPAAATYAYEPLTKTPRACTHTRDGPVLGARGEGGSQGVRNRESGVKRWRVALEHTGARAATSGGALRP